jgi:hypothetical protein
MKPRIHYPAAILALSLLLGASLSAFQKTHREITKSKEKELNVVVDVSFGSLYLQKVERNQKDKVAVVDYEYRNEDSDKLQINYDLSGETGKLRIKQKRMSRWSSDDDDDLDSHKTRRLTIYLTADIPISFDLELGAGKGDIDLSSLQVSDLKISTGASSVDLRCDDPNPISAESVEIESGVSKFSAFNLNNINFRKMKFDGGVGSYKLDFGGKLQQNASVSIEVGLGAISVVIPKETQTKVLYEDGWFSSFDVDRNFTKQRSGVYLSDDGDKGRLLTMKIESGLGSVKVKQK